MDELCYERRFPDVCRCVLAAVGALVLAMSLGGSQSTDTVFGSELPRCKGMPSGSPQCILQRLMDDYLLALVAVWATRRLALISHDVAIVRVDESEQLPSPLPIAVDIDTRAVAVNYQVLGANTQDSSACHPIDDPAVVPVAWCRRDGGGMELLSGLGKDDSGETVVLPGASGGPLINSVGEVMGATVAYSPYPLFLDEAQRVCGADEDKAYYAYAVDPVVIAALLGSD